jgi:phytol kinase
MLHDLLIVGTLLCVSRAALWGVSWFDRRGAGAAELSRKLLHVAMGLILCPLPWLFDRAWPVIVLCAVYVGLLIARRFLVALDNHVAPVIDGVGRRSVGEFLFPIAVAVVFVLSGGDRAAYLAAILVLTLADAAAAVVGRHYGTWRFTTPGGSKSLEGSAAFAIVAFASVHLTFLLLGSAGRVETVLLALAVALTLTGIEAVVTGGWDNLLVPVGACLMIKGFQGSSASLLLLLLGGVVATMPVLTLLFTRLAPPAGVEGGSEA